MLDCNPLRTPCTRKALLLKGKRRAAHSKLGVTSASVTLTTGRKVSPSDEVSEKISEIITPIREPANPTNGRFAKRSPVSPKLGIEWYRQFIASFGPSPRERAGLRRAQHYRRFNHPHRAPFALPEADEKRNRGNPNPARNQQPALVQPALPNPYAQPAQGRQRDRQQQAHIEDEPSVAGAFDGAAKDDERRVEQVVSRHELQQMLRERRTSPFTGSTC